MKKFGLVASIAAVLIGFASPVAAAKPATDAVSRMFTWWDQAFKTPGAFTAANFSKYFTPDATLDLDGKTVIHGVDQWAAHFQKIQASGANVEIVVPFKEVFVSGDKIYTYHVIRSRRAGVASCSLAAGHAVMRGDKIASIALVRSVLDPAKGPIDPECWTK